MPWFIHSKENTFYMLGCYLGCIYIYKNYQVEAMTYKGLFLSEHQKFHGQYLLQPHFSVKKVNGKDRDY
jgi:hypothetical protein